MTALLTVVWIAANVCAVVSVWVIVRSLVRIANAVRSGECPRCRGAA